MLTFKEIKELLAERYDAVELIGVLQIESTDLVEAFEDKIEDRVDFLQELLADEPNDNDTD